MFNETFNGTFLNISFAFEENPPFKSYLHMLEEWEIQSFLKDKNLITKLDPTLGQSKVQMIYFPEDDRDGKNMTFVYIEGTRCKSDGLNSRCWSTPSFCLGWEQYCFEADDELSLCNNQDLDSSIPYYETSSLVDSSKLLWAEPNILLVLENHHFETEIIKSDPLMYDWDCIPPPPLEQEEERNVTDVLCTTTPNIYFIYKNIIDKVGSLQLLKTIAGG